MAIYQNLKIIRASKKLTQRDVAQAIGVAQTSYLAWEKGISKPKCSNLEKLASFFDVSIDELTKDDKQELINIYDQLTEKYKSEVLNYSKLQFDKQKEKAENSTVLLFPNKVYEKLSAGTGFGYFGDGSYDVVYSDKEFDYDFASWIYGDSMEPEYINGSVALIRDTTFDYDGAVYAVEWDGETYIKRVYKEKNGLRLVSTNPKYKDKFAPFDENPRIIGKIIGNFMPIDKKE